jgi:hypothetical protein
MDKGVCQILTTNTEMKMVCAMMVPKTWLMTNDYRQHKFAATFQTKLKLNKTRNCSRGQNVNYPFYLEVLQHGGKRWKRCDLRSNKCTISHCNVCEAVSDATSSLFSQFASMWLVRPATETGTFESPEEVQQHTSHKLKVISKHVFHKWFPNMVGNSFVYSCKREEDNSN